MQSGPPSCSDLKNRISNTLTQLVENIFICQRYKTQCLSGLARCQPASQLATAEAPSLVIKRSDQISLLGL